MELIKQVEKVPVKFLSSINGYAGLCEVRVGYESNIYRIFCCFDKVKLVVLFNGFQKKTQKTPKKEIEHSSNWLKKQELKRVISHGLRMPGEISNYQL